MILESERRWDDWQGGIPIELPDGQTWWFCAPEATVREGLTGWTFGPDVPADVDRVLSWRFTRLIVKVNRAGNEADRAAAMIEAAWFLLARNYAITPDEFESILALSSEWDESRQDRLGRELLTLVGFACVRATALAEVA